MNGDEPKRRKCIPSLCYRNKKKKIEADKEAWYPTRNNDSKLTLRLLGSKTIGE